MTKKDYKLIAEALKEAREESNPLEGRSGVTLAAQKLANVLRADNPRFDYKRFLEACGVPETEWNQ